MIRNSTESNAFSMLNNCRKGFQPFLTCSGSTSCVAKIASLHKIFSISSLANIEITLVNKIASKGLRPQRSGR